MWNEETAWGTWMQLKDIIKVDLKLCVRDVTGINELKIGATDRFL
jgi:hypothetical protein